MRIEKTASNRGSATDGSSLEFASGVQVNSEIALTDVFSKYWLGAICSSSA